MQSRFISNVARKIYEIKWESVIKIKHIGYTFICQRRIRKRQNLSEIKKYFAINLSSNFPIQCTYKVGINIDQLIESHEYFMRDRTFHADFFCVAGEEAPRHEIAKLLMAGDDAEAECDDRMSGFIVMQFKSRLLFCCQPATWRDTKMAI